MIPLGLRVHRMPGATKEPVLREIADGVHAYLQTGSWGFSNAGLITGGGESLLVDTLYDVPLTERMIAEMRRVVPAARRIATVVNTHANGDHCWGNQVVRGANIVSTKAAAAEMKELSPRLMATLVRASRLIANLGPWQRAPLRVLGALGVGRAGALAEAAQFIVECFGAFDFRGVSLTLPTTTFEREVSLAVGDRTVQVIEVGPAHTRGDAIVYLPKEKVAFTGDILFVGSHPIIWEGPVQNWIAACDRLLALDVDVIVPGHGPITDKAGVRTTKEYWERLVETTRRGRDAGLTAQDIARELFRDAKEAWGESHRLAVNVDTIFRGMAGTKAHPDPLALMARMARLENERAVSSSPPR
jgi:glyoxylase-like metal-dependent hydrolase (beta-lactamase superfamily II)